MEAVNFTLTIFGKCSFKSLTTASPSSVGLSCFCSRTTYSREVMVDTIEAYVLGLPTPVSSSILMSEPSV